MALCDLGTTADMGGCLSFEINPHWPHDPRIQCADCGQQAIGRIIPHDLMILLLT